MNKAIIFTDGGARGNPGPAGIGVVIKDKGGKIIGEYNEYIGETTNNQAEYKAVLLALDKAEEMGFEDLEFYLDSKLVVEQLNQNYKVKEPELAKLFVKIWNKLQNFKKYSFAHVRREKNIEADAQVNLALDNNI
ncbi:MAG: ribonuclease HI family protein [Patescibacteria group bacterium]|nr:ribonuclease HI family protein [Patescibacteria group bacterium]